MHEQNAALDAELVSLAKNALKLLQETQANPGWEEFADKPCTMLKMEIEGRYASRGQCIVNYPIKQVFQFLNKNGTIQKLNPKCKTYKILYEVKNHDLQHTPFVNYMEYTAIWPVANRDFVSIKTSESNEDVCYIASRVCSYPCEEVKGIVRGTMHIGGYILKKIDDNSTLVIYISDVDIAGSIPGMLKKQLAKNQGSIAASIEKTMKG